jgi:hypothetical protein
MKTISILSIGVVLTLLHQEHRIDTIEPIPASHRTVDMVPDITGNWLVHCHGNLLSLFNKVIFKIVDGHMIAGMQAIFTVES